MDDQNRLLDPTELRITTIYGYLHELQIDADHGRLTNAQTAELGTIAEQAVDTWRIALRAMVERMEQNES